MIRIVFLLAAILQIPRNSCVLGSGASSKVLQDSPSSIFSPGCQCWNDEIEPECVCRGQQIYSVPKNLTTNILRLTVDDSSIQILSNYTLIPFKSHLRDFTLIKNKMLDFIEPGIFNGLQNLASVYIFQAPSLKTLDEDVFRVKLPKLKMLRVFHSGLEEMPHLNHLNTDSHLDMVDLENNHIHRISTGQVKITAERLILNYNEIVKIEPRAFEGSQIDTLSLRGNKKLTTVYEDSFKGIHSLRVLDLSETSITFLPTVGLGGLEELKLQDVTTMKVFPSIYNFNSLTKVFLTYPYHCCAFHYPARHDPQRHKQHQAMLQKMREACRDKSHHSWGHEMGDMSEDGEVFHVAEATPGPIKAFCGNLSSRPARPACSPEPDPFNPCEDLMGNWGLRVAVWIVAVAALFGNAAVLLVLLSSRFRMTVPKFLMCNLAAADFCMGLYLLLIAVQDARSIGDYFNYAIDWQSGAGCQVSGFLTVFSSELSILTLTVITCERWYTITYAIHMNKRLKLSTAVKIMALGWLYAITMAALPLLGVSGYYKTSICLPMQTRRAEDVAYLVTLLTFNGLAFWVICACYSRMYCSIRRGGEPGAGPSHSDTTVAKKMALLVFTDFACWAPIAFFGLTALAGYPLINVTNTKILLVFFYPLNSCANPYLYALLTHQYRRDVLMLLSRYGLCTERAAKYKGAGVGWTGGMGAGGRGTGCSKGAQGGPRGSVLTTLTSLDLGPKPVPPPQPNGHQASTV